MSSTKSAFGKNKLKNVKALLKLYRKVLYSVNNNLYYLDEEVYVNSRRHLSDLVDSLVEFECSETSVTMEIIKWLKLPLNS